MSTLNVGFFRSEQLLPFIHILGVILFITIQICSVVAIRMCSKVLSQLQDKNYCEVLRYYRFYEKLFVLFFILVVVSGFFLSNEENFKFADPMVTGTIATLWVASIFIVVNFIYIRYKFRLLKKDLNEKNTFEAKEHLIIITKYFIPLNIVVSITCVYLCVCVSKF